MRIGYKLAAGGAIVAFAFGTLGVANAQTTTTFAQVNQSTGAGAIPSSFIYTDTSSSVVGPITGTTAVGTYSFNSSDQLSFTYLVNNTLTGGPSTVTATLVGFSATAVGTAQTQSFFGTTLTGQNVTNIVGEFETSTGGDLLKIAFSSGQLTFQAGSGQASFTANDSASGTPTSNLADFGSSYLDFNNPNGANQYYSKEGFTFSLSGVSNTGTGGGSGPVVNAANNTVQSFAADASMTFSSNPTPYAAVPEPSALALVTLGAGTVFVPALRRKRSKKA